MPSLKLEDVKETALYVADLARAKDFYQRVFGLTALFEDTRLCALDVNSRHVLLLFLRGASTGDTILSGGVLPGHDASGTIHVAFSIPAHDLDAWCDELARHNVEVLSEVHWPRGGRSIYFRDPDGHLLELLTPGVWATY